MMTLLDGKTRTEVADLKPGWYVIGFDLIDGTPDYGPIYQYHGEDYWTDESGEEVESIWDPICQAHVETGGADFYVRT